MWCWIKLSVSKNSKWNRNDWGSAFIGSFKRLFGSLSLVWLIECAVFIARMDRTYLSSSFFTTSTAPQFWEERFFQAKSEGGTKTVYFRTASWLFQSVWSGAAEFCGELHGRRKSRSGLQKTYWALFLKIPEGRWGWETWWKGPKKVLWYFARTWFRGISSKWRGKSCSFGGSSGFERLGWNERRFTPKTFKNLYNLTLAAF